ncbi:hypothetical protein ACIBO2_51885 [Nonomuraea sp. NPDC050022]|uniref:hypothetical protein n=1 Tax=unclassified Nonomuraea TaxID=2593643 RepID=UPI0033FD6D7D
MHLPVLRCAQHVAALTFGGSQVNAAVSLEWAWSLYAPIPAVAMQQGGHFNKDLSKIEFE